MFKNYLKVALRTVQRNKIFSFINILGLALGMACSILIFLYVSHELSYDRHHKDAHRIFRVALKISRETREMETARVSAPLVPVIRENFPGVEHVVRFQPLGWMRNLVRRNDKKFYEDRVMIAENEIFNVFSIPFIKGDPKTALTRPVTVVITEQMEEKYFGAEDAMGKTLSMYGNNFEVTGVVVDPPDNTHIKYGFIVSILGWEKVWNFDNWGWTGFYAYVKLKPNVNTADFENKIRHIADITIPEKLEAWGEKFTFFLQPISRIHLHSNLKMEIEPPGNTIYIYIFSVIGFLIILVSSINFTNLSTAQSASRAKEVGVRKVVGASRGQLARQFLVETFLTTGLSFLVSLGLVTLVFPIFNELSGKHFNTQVLFSPNVLLILLGMAVFVGLISGAYPAFFLSHFKSMHTIKGSLYTDIRGALFRKILVAGQFSITIILIIATLMVFRQVSFMQNEYLGFEKEQKLIIPIVYKNNHESIKAEFLKFLSITGATALWSVPGRQTNIIEARLVGEIDEKSQSMNFHYVDHDFIPEYKIGMAAGRAFQKEMSTDVLNAFVINETAAQAFGLESPEEALGKKMYEGGSGNVAPIIGVVKDFHFKGLQTIVEPLVLQVNPGFFGQLSLTIKTENLSATLSFIEKKWQELQLGEIFSYFFLDEDFNRQYGSEKNIEKLLGIFTLLAIFVACLGLFGLSLFSAKLKTKEIGIRKVLGASVLNILILLSKEFTKWILLANIIAWPVAYFGMRIWLQNFAYRASFGLEIFIFSGVLALFVAILSLSYQSIRAAVANPVDSLRYE